MAQRKNLFIESLSLTVKARGTADTWKMSARMIRLFDPAKVTLKSERIKYWIDQGAKPSDTVRSLLKKEGFFAASA